MQSTPPYPVLDGLRTQAELEELAPGDDAMLPGCQLPSLAARLVKGW